MNIILSKPGKAGKLPILIPSLKDLSLSEVEGKAISVAVDIDMCNSTFNFNTAKIEENLEFDGLYEDQLRKKDLFISTLRRELSEIGIELISDN